VQQKQVPGRWTVGRNTEEEVEIQTEGFWKGFGRGLEGDLEGVGGREGVTEEFFSPETPHDAPHSSAIDE